MSYRHRTSDKPPCPHCGGVMMRVPRDLQEREKASLKRYRRFRCCDAACDWQGMLPVKRPTPYTRVPDALTQPASAAPAVHRSAPVVASTSYASDAPAIQIQVQLSAAAKHSLKRWAPVGATLVLGAVLASSAFLADRASPSLPMQMVNGKALPLGESDYGVPLPAKHPMLMQAAFKPDAAAEGAGSGESPLELRQNCAWGRPGGNPYKGTVEQALNTARLPPEVVKAIAAKVKANEVTDDLVISNEGIKGQRLGRDFSSRGFAMTYGHSICLSTSVHFRPGHVERAALYEVNDDQGRLHSVMVPEVCGNVSVLSERGRRLPVNLLAAGDNGEVLLAQAGDVAGEGGVRSVSDQGGSLAVPEPGTLPSVLLGLAVLLWAVRRRR